MVRLRRAAALLFCRFLQVPALEPVSEGLEFFLRLPVVAQAEQALVSLELQFC